MHAHVHPHGATLHSARFYDLSVSLLGGRVRRLHERLLAVAALQRGERVLDVGCGPGRLSLAAAERTGPEGEVLGIDASPEMIELAAGKARHARSRARFEVAALEALPLTGAHFDLVLASLMIHHLPAELQARGVSEVLRVLKPNGRFVIGDFSAEPGHGVGHLLSVLGLRRGSAHADHLCGLLGAAGFEAVGVEPGVGGFCVVRGRKPARS